VMGRMFLGKDKANWVQEASGIMRLGTVHYTVSNETLLWLICL
jgi:hypothetical protein